MMGYLLIFGFFIRKNKGNDMPIINVLRRGSKGTAVKKLQSYLSKLMGADNLSGP